METPNPAIELALQGKLQEVLNREVYLMRELLSNMHQEEISLILHDQGSLHQVLVQRSFLLEKLSSLRTNKLETLKAIEHLSSHPNPSLEISSLGDQLLALTDKINRQLSTNQRLNAHPEYYAHLDTQISESIRPKKKVTVATLQIKK